MKKGSLCAIVLALYAVNCQAKNSDMKEKIIKHKDIELYTESIGDKKDTAILLIAGATVSMLYWDDEFCKLLSDKGYFVIRYDNRDVGKSTCYTPGTTPYDIVDLTDDAIAILDGYGIDKAHFFGMSLGGLICQIAAIKHPERVESLILFATGPWGDSDPTIPEMDSRILEFHSKADSVNWTVEDSVVNYLIQGAALMSGRKPFDKQRSEDLIRSEFKRAKNYLSMFNHAALQGGEEYWNRLNEIKQETLVIHGTDDLIWHYKNADMLCSLIEDSKLITLEGTGHELHFSDWPLITESVANHIRSAPRN